MSKDYKHRIEPGREGKGERDRVINWGRETEAGTDRQSWYTVFHMYM